MIDKTTHENAVNDVRNGMSYEQAAKIHGVEGTSVERWCRTADVQSPHASGRKTDKEILDVVRLHKAITCRALAEVLGCSDSAANNHLKTMVMDGKIQSFRIPSLCSSARTRRGFFTKFINTKIYYVSKDDLAIWVRNQLPEEDLPMSLRKYVTHIFRSLDIKIFVDETWYQKNLRQKNEERRRKITVKVP